MAVVDLFSGDKWTASPYIRGSEGKLDFMEWILFHFYRRLLDGVLPWQSKNTAAAIPPKKKSQVQPREEEKGGKKKKKTHFRSLCHVGTLSPWASLFHGAHGTDGRVERK